MENLLALIKIDLTYRWWYGVQSAAFFVKWPCISCGTDGARLIMAEFCQSQYTAWHVSVGPYCVEKVSEKTHLSELMFRVQ